MTAKISLSDGLWRSRPRKRGTGTSLGRATCVGRCDRQPVADGDPAPEEQRWRSSECAALLDDLVGASEERERERKSERLGGLHVDNQLDSRDLLDRQVGGLVALENPAGVEAGDAIYLGSKAAVAHEAAGFNACTALEDRRQRMTRCQ